MRIICTFRFRLPRSHSRESRPSRPSRIPAEAFLLGFVAFGAADLRLLVQKRRRFELFARCRHFRAVSPRHNNNNNNNNNNLDPRRTSSAETRSGSIRRVGFHLQNDGGNGNASRWWWWWWWWRFLGRNRVDFVCRGLGRGEALRKLHLRPVQRRAGLGHGPRRWRWGAFFFLSDLSCQMLRNKRKTTSFSRESKKTLFPNGGGKNRFRVTFSRVLFCLPSSSTVKST